MFIGIFDRFCLPHLGDVGAVRREAAIARFAPVPPSSPAAVLARPGRVFDAGHHLLLLSLDNGLCGVMGGPVDGGAVLAAFASAMRAEHVAVTPVGNAPEGAPQAYRLAGPALDATVMVGIRGAAIGASAVSMLATPAGSS